MSVDNVFSSTTVVEDNPFVMSALFFFLRQFLFLSKRAKEKTRVRERNARGVVINVDVDVGDDVDDRNDDNSLSALDIYSFTSCSVVLHVGV